MTLESFKLNPDRKTRENLRKVVKDVCLERGIVDDFYLEDEQGNEEIFVYSVGDAEQNTVGVTLITNYKEDGRHQLEAPPDIIEEVKSRLEIS